MMAIAFASLLVGAIASVFCFTGVALSHMPVLPGRWVVAGKEILKFGASGLAASSCGVLILALGWGIAHLQPRDAQAGTTAISAAPPAGQGIAAMYPPASQAPSRPWP
jgi:hypothetical protein